MIKTWQRDYGFDFDLANRLLPCPICCGTHESNQYQCKLMLSQLCKVQNNSLECKQTKVNYIITGWEDNAVIREIVFHPTGEDPYIKLYESWLEMRGERICWDSRGPFYRHDGATWMLYDEAGIATDLKILRERVLKPLAIYVGMQQRNNPKDEDLKKMSEGLDRANAFLMKAHSVEHVIKTGRHLLLERGLEAKMDKDPYLLGTADGVINLRTGELAVGAPDMWVTKRVAVAYHGLDHPTPDVDAFFNGRVQRGTSGVIAFLQRFLGYGITGLTVEEAFAIFYGTGGNGKGVLVEMLEAALGDYYVSMHQDAVFGQQKKGQAEPYLAELDGARIGLCDESDAGEAC